jgi:hypothetical protein
VASFVHKYLRRKRLLARAEQLYLQVCEVLGERSMESSDEAKWVVASRLRDHLLLPSERKLKTLWKEVELMVQEDSRIDQYQKMVKGELRIVWEWQGKLLAISRIERFVQNRMRNTEKPTTTIV